MYFEGGNESFDDAMRVKNATTDTLAKVEE